MLELILINFLDLLFFILKTFSFYCLVYKWSLAFAHSFTHCLIYLCFPYHFVLQHRWYAKDPVLLQWEGGEPKWARLPGLQRQGHTPSQVHMVTGRRPRHQRQPPPPGLLRDARGPCGQPAQCHTHPGAGRRGVPVHMQQLSWGRVPPGSNKRKRCLSNQLLQEQQYTYLSVSLCVCLSSSWTVSYCSLLDCWLLFGLKISCKNSFFYIWISTIGS